MKLLFPVILCCMMLTGPGSGTLDVIDESNGAIRRQWSVRSDGGSRDLVVLTAGPVRNMSKIVYIFHGYKPAGDPYGQDPSRFMSAWDLDRLARVHNILFVLPDFGDSVYPVSAAADPLSDLGMAVSLHRYLAAGAGGDVPVLVMGFSAGVEGVVKFASLINCTEIVCISGNYDLRILPPGEMRFHRRVFGEDPSRLTEESPLTIMARMGKIDLHLFCEENNRGNNEQAALLVEHRPPNVNVIDHRSLGRGHSHDWRFLSDPAVKRELHSIILKAIPPAKN